MTAVSKEEAARRQLETAIDLFFNDGDSLSTYSLAYSAFRLLFDIYPHRQGDDFSAQIDAMLGKEGWRAFSGIANFLKHADRDRDALLENHLLEDARAPIGLSTLLYRRIVGEMTLKMRAFDSWTESIWGIELGIPEMDERVERASAHQAEADNIRTGTSEERMAAGARHYRLFLDNHDRILALVDAAQAEGINITQLFDRLERRSSNEGNPT